MSEDEKDKKDIKIIWVDGYPCIELPSNTIMKKRQKSSVESPFKFGRLQMQRKKKFMPEILKELEKMFNKNLNTPFFPANWKIYEINQWGEVKELKDEDEENDNAR